MKLSVLVVAAGLAVVPVAALAQKPDSAVEQQKAAPVKAVRPVYLNQGMVDRMMWLMQAEANGRMALNDALSQATMTRSEYVARKNALYIAKLDASDEARLQAVQEDKNAFKVRQANAQLYVANQSRIDAALVRVQPDPACTACVPN